MSLGQARPAFFELVTFELACGPEAPDVVESDGNTVVETMEEVGEYVGIMREVVAGIEIEIAVELVGEEGIGVGVDEIGIIWWGT